jgi:hypothetical protein
MTCVQPNCAVPPTWRVFWPGKPPALMCTPHKEKALGVGEAIGCPIHAEPLEAQVHGVRFLQENALALATMAVAGFSIMYLADPGDLDDKKLREEFLETVRELRACVPRDRAFLVLDALNELPGDAAATAMLKELTAEMRRKG